VDKYIALSADYVNPADTSSKQGAKFTLDSTAYWNGQNMRRIELIPQTTAPINQGKVWYHFTISRREANAPSQFREHQINFFESHFTELKSGWISGEAGTSNPKLQWMVSQQSKWSVDEWQAGVFYNFAYEIVSFLAHFALPDQAKLPMTGAWADLYSTAFRTSRPTPSGSGTLLVRTT
jgi:hypothetical protein